MSENQSVRVRFAPSPTGYMHVGNFRSALYNYLFAKKNSGTFLLRIEDTDQSRFVPGATESLVRTLSNMNVLPTEGVGFDATGQLTERGEYGPYTQSKRLDLYRKYALDLVESKQAYYCFCSADRLESMRRDQIAAKAAPRYDRHCLSLSSEKVQQYIAEGRPSVIRFRIPDDREVVCDDLIRGRVAFQTRDTDDQILLKSDGFPTYHLAVVVDDHAMHITHVIRAEEWLPSTPKHLLLYEAFGWQAPKFAHLPLLLNPDKSKLSKRQGDVAVEDYLKKGYLKETLINFVALLGWNPGKGSQQEIFTLEELVNQFDITNVHKAGAVFDLEKLNWMNTEYIKKLSVPDLYQRIVEGNFLEKDLIQLAPEAFRSKAYLFRLLEVERERLTRLGDIGEEHPYCFTEAKQLAYPSERLQWKEQTVSETQAMLEKALILVGGITDDLWTREKLQELLLSAAGDKRGDFLWPLRVALSGEERSPGPQDLLYILGQDEANERITKALSLLRRLS